MNVKHVVRFAFLLVLPLLVTMTATAQTRTVTGTVVDDSTKAPVAGVTIKVKDGPQTAITSDQGIFTLNVPATGAVLQYSHVNYEFGEVPVTLEGPMSIAIKRLVNSLDEIVVVGYGTQRKSHLTGAVETIKGSEVQDLPTGSLGTALAGRVLGLSVSGGLTRPGSQPTIRLRNPESVSKDGGTTTPLIVIDGMIQVTSQGLNDATLFNALDPTEIESISFLKDGAAAIYGSRAAAGAVIVTTKRGVSGKPRITYNGSYGWNQEAYRTKMMSAYDLARYINIVNGPNGANQDPNTTNSNQFFFSPDELEHYKTIDHNWLDQAWESAYNTRHTVNLSGGGEKATYFAGLSYFTQDGNLGKLDFGRWTYRAGADMTVATGLKAGLQVSGILTDAQRVNSELGGENIENDYRNLLMAPRYVPPYIDGLPVRLPGSGNNLSAYHFFEINNINNYIVNKDATSTVNLYVEYEPTFLKGLKARGSYARNTTYARTNRLGSRYALYNFDLQGENGHIYEGATPAGSQFYTNDNRVRVDNQRSQLYQANFSLSYNKSIGKHDISGLFSAERSEAESTQEEILRDNPYDDGNGQLLSGAYGPWDGRSFAYEGGTLGYVGRANYAYDDKYLAEFLFRTDASTKFAPENYWGKFFSISAGWVISKEKFFKSDVVNFLKLRYSYGKTGSDDANIWAWRQRYTFQNGQGGVFGPADAAATTGIKMERSPNRDARWSDDYKQNIGIDARFLKNRLSTTVEGFYNKARNVLVNRVANVPLTIGGSVAAQNFGASDYFGLELGMAWDDKIGSDFTYGVSARLSWYENKLVTADVNPTDLLYPWFTTRPGQSGDIGVWGYDYMGMFQTQAEVDAYIQEYGITSVFGTPVDQLRPGSFYYRDVRGPLQSDGTFAGPDGIIDNNDQIKLANKSSNHWGLGSTIKFGYKGFNFESVITGSWGGWAEMDGRTLLQRNISNLYQNGVAYWSDIYDPELNPGGRYPNPFYSAINLAPRSDFWRVGSFRLRMRNVNLNYSIPKHIVNKANINSARVVFTVLNPINFYNPFSYRDADNAWDNYPILRTYSLGLNLSL